MLGRLLYTSVKLVMGTIYPAYSSFKAVKSKDVKEYVHWITYWIVFALWTLLEEMMDIFVSFWWPLYFESKILVLIWLLSPATRGSSLIYRQLVHPCLVSKEEEIDLLMERWRQQGYQLGLRYTKVAAQKITTTVLETAVKGGGGLMSSLRHSYSLTDLRKTEAAEVEEKFCPVKEVEHKETTWINMKEEGAVIMRESGFDEVCRRNQRAMVRSWHVGSGEEDTSYFVAPVQRKKEGTRSKSRPQSMTFPFEEYYDIESVDDVRNMGRISGRANVIASYGTLPRLRPSGFRPVAKKAKSRIADDKSGRRLRRIKSSLTIDES